MPNTFQDYVQGGLAQGCLSGRIQSQREKTATTTTATTHSPRENIKKKTHMHRWPSTALEQSLERGPLSGEIFGWKDWSCEQGEDL